MAAPLHLDIKWAQSIVTLLPCYNHKPQAGYIPIIRRILSMSMKYLQLLCHELTPHYHRNFFILSKFKRYSSVLNGPNRSQRTPKRPQQTSKGPPTDHQWTLNGPHRQLCHGSCAMAIMILWQ